MLVKFATVCDYTPGPCGVRSPEYTAWPYCRVCGVQVCPDHQRPGSQRGDEHPTCLCLDCEE